MKGYAKFSEDQKYRYLLGRVWDDEALPLVWVMLNPSTADARKADATIHTVTRLTRRWGYGGFWVVNLFGFRTPEPAELRAAQRAGQDIVGPDNDRWVRWAVDKSTEPILAWGRNGRHYGARIERVVTMLSEIRRPLRCIGTTQGGHPRHPLLSPKDSHIQVYDPLNSLLGYQ